jgi:acyl dehydratase
VAELWFEDFVVGRRFLSAGHTITEAEILDFARRFDPQPFHVDPEAARASPYGGLIASGIQTIALTFRLFLDTSALASTSLGSPGLDEVRWRLPVRPGDTLRVAAEVTGARRSASKPDRGVVTIRYEARNQHGETVLSMIGHQLVRRAGDPGVPGGPAP